MFRYYSTQRPISPGTFPGKPSEIHNYDVRTDTGLPHVGMAWGWLIYPEPLTVKDSSDYELVAHDARSGFIYLREDEDGTAEISREYMLRLIGDSCNNAERVIAELEVGLLTGIKTRFAYCTVMTISDIMEELRSSLGDKVNLKYYCQHREDSIGGRDDDKTITIVDIDGSLVGFYILDDGKLIEDEVICWSCYGQCAPKTNCEELKSCMYEV